MKKQVLLLTVFDFLNATAQIDPAYKVYYGLLHAHSLISDGSGTPAQAFSMAKSKGLQFFALTPHNHFDAERGARERRDEVLIAKQPALYNGTGNVTVTRNWKENGIPRTETITIKPLIKAARDATDANFVALYGQEFSTISSGNHMNVLGIDDMIGVKNGNYKDLIAKLKNISDSGGREPVLQMNHPDIHMDLFYKGTKESTRKKMFNDYGIDTGDLGPHFSTMVKALDPYTHLIEILSGPAMSDTVPPNFRYDATDNDYFFYLKQGFHISPSVGQDNHYRTWGGITDARVGIVSKSLSERAIYEALKLNRSFATEDKNLKVILYLNDSLMGSSISAEEESELAIKVLVEDVNEPLAEYFISIYGGEINPELSTEATSWKAVDGLLETIHVTKNGVYAVSGIFAEKNPSFYYARVVQNSTDRSWTAPVWVNEKKDSVTILSVDSLFFWTANPSSKVFHISGCTAIERIKPENRMSGVVPPAGRIPHDCNVAIEPDH